MPKGVYKRTPAHLAIMTKARNKSAKLPRSTKQVNAFNRARDIAHTNNASTSDFARQTLLTYDSKIEDIKATLDNDSELFKLIEEQLKDARSFVWGSLKTVSLDTSLYVDKEGKSRTLHEWLPAVQDYEQELNDRIDRLVGY